MPEYRHNGLTIRQVKRPVPADHTMTAWDIYDGDKLLKCGFASLEVAKHYIDTRRGKA